MKNKKNIINLLKQLKFFSKNFYLNKCQELKTIKTSLIEVNEDFKKENFELKHEI